MQSFAPAMTIKTERRKKFRNRPRSLVYVELESANGGMMRDLSEEGFALRAMMPLQAGGKTQFAFSLDGERRISGEGRIAWVKEDGRVAGIEFCGITQSAREEIREWLTEAEKPAVREQRPAAFGVSEPSTLEELREEARTTLAKVAVPKVRTVKVAPPREPEIAPASVSKVASPEELVEEVHSSLPQIAVPPAKPGMAASSHEAEIAPAPVPKVTLPEERREEVHSRLPRIVLPTVKPVEAAPDDMAEKSPVAVPEVTLGEEQHEEALFTLPRVSLASVGSAGSAELAETHAKSMAAPTSEPPSELRDVSKAAPMKAPEPLLPESTPEVLPEREEESEFSERVEEPPGKRFTLTKAIGIMVLLVLIAGAVAGHRQVGHALIWVGQAIAGDGTPPPHSLVNEPLEPANQKPGSALRDSLPAVPAGSVGATGDNGQQEYERAEEILRDRKQEAEIGEAVKLLWLAAQKGNVNGTMTLAELYRKGRGVKKDCTQARILLSTAALKGSVEAREQLGKLAQEGCE